MKERRAIDVRILGKKRTGDETVFFELTREVLRQDQEHEYLLLTNETDSDSLNDLRMRLGLGEGDTQRRIVTLPATNRFWWNLFTLPYFLWQNNVTLLHTQYILPFWVPAYTKVINHIHDVSFASLPQFIGKKDLFFLNLLIPRSLRRSDRIVTPSQFTKGEIIKYYQVPEEKISVVPNAIGTQFLSTIDEEISDQELREKYRLPKTYLLYVGTLQPRKNIPFLIRAFAKYTHASPDMHLVIVGNKKGHHFDRGIDVAVNGLEEEIAKKIIFPGYVEEKDLPRIFRMANTFIFPSLYEGFGIPLLEAMSQKIPVIASDIPCLREVGGEAVLYFDIKSVDSLVQKLYDLKDSEAIKADLVHKGTFRVQSFSWQKSGAQLLVLYKA
jgi:glycosyltransferase involved in cell wall biosynthesis